jgi:tetratricopeptide (TPR) repeat protein
LAADNVPMGEGDSEATAFEARAHDVESALAALPAEGSAAAAQRGDLLLKLGEAWSRAGDRTAAQDAFLQAAELARGNGDTRLLARAAIGYGARFVQAPGVADPGTIALLEEALEATAKARSVERVRLLGRLCSALYYSDGRKRIGEISRQALAIADELDDDGARAHACSARHRALWEPEHVEERLAAATDLVRLAERAGDDELSAQGRGWLLVDLLERGDIAAVDSQLSVFEVQAQRLAQPLYSWNLAVFQAMRAILAGDFAEGERLARRAVEIGQRGESATAVHYFATQLFAIRRDQGRLEELVGSVEDFVQRFPAIPAWRCALTHVYQELGREQDARRELAALLDEGLDRLPRDVNWLIGVTLLAEACAALEDRGGAETLYELLLPYRRSAVVIGLAAVCGGSASRHLGLLAAVLHRSAEARRHFELALRMNAGLGGLPLLARTQAEYAGLLLELGRPDDAERAGELLGEARATAERLEMHGLLAHLPL